MRLYDNGSEEQVKVLPNLQNLVVFTTTKSVTNSHMRWMEALTEFHLKIEYGPAKVRGKTGP